METIKNVKLSFKCTEDFNKMSPCETGRHCSVCVKTVVDFRNSNTVEYEKQLSENESVCGIFIKEQIQTEENKFSIVTFFKKYAANFLITIGLGTFTSELFAQGVVIKDTVKNKEIIEDYYLGEVVQNSPQYKNGGNAGLQEFLKKNIIQPSDSIFGKVIVTYWIDKNGKVQDPKIIQSLSEQSDREVLRVVKLLEFTAGNWGKEYYKLPISF